MKKSLFSSLIAVGIGLALFATNASASTIIYNDNVTAIYGAGNPDTGWTTTADSAHNLELSLRAKNRSDGTTPNDGAGTYSFLPGIDSGGRAIWNYEFSINTNASGIGVQNLNAFEFYLSAIGPSFGPFTVNALTVFTDNSYGNNGTANGLGVEGLSSALASTNNIAQNSQNIVFAGGNPLASGLYKFSLYATAVGSGAGGARLAQADINVNTNAVPEPSSLALLLVGAFAIGQRVRRKL